MLLKAHIPMREPAPVREAEQRRKLDMSRYHESRTDDVATSTGEGPKRPSPVHIEKRVGRNDPCPCGSGKKYKSCHGINEN